jgi:hypothetical protein
MSLPLRLAIMPTPVAVWGMLYFASRLGGISLIRFLPWLRAEFVVLMGTSLMLFVFDRTSASDVVALHAWGLFGAQLWIGRHYKLDTRQFLTSLKLSVPQTTASPASGRDHSGLDS